MKDHWEVRSPGPRSIAAGLILFVAALSYLAGDGTLDRTRAEAVAVPTQTPRQARVARPAPYSQFSHSTRAHRVECSSCHKFPSSNWQTVRKEGAFPDITEYPRHESCIQCHRQQFFRGARPAICSICHTSPGPRGRTRHAFPNPREVFDLAAKGKSAVSDFSVSFPHAKHVDLVSRVGRSERFISVSEVGGSPLRMADESCAVCHQTYKPQGEGADEYVSKPPADLGDSFWLKKGTFKTSPIGHSSCFTCHSADTGIQPEPQNCSACHVLKQPVQSADFDSALATRIGVVDKIELTAWRRRNASGTFRHEWFSHAEVSCSSCHNAATINTVDPATKNVTVAACSTCHVTATADDGGAMNFEIDARKANPSFQCVKCHIAFGRMPIPMSHTKAIDAAKPAAGK